MLAGGTFTLMATGKTPAGGGPRERGRKAPRGPGRAGQRGARRTRNRTSRARRMRRVGGAGRPVVSPPAVVRVRGQGGRPKELWDFLVRVKVFHAPQSVPRVVETAVAREAGGQLEDAGPRKQRGFTLVSPLRLQFQTADLTDPFNEGRAVRLATDFEECPSTLAVLGCPPTTRFPRCGCGVRGCGR